MAEAAIAVAAESPAEDTPKTGEELRDKLIATAKELTKAKAEKADKDKPVADVEKPADKAKPADAKPKEEKPKADAKKPDAEDKPKEEALETEAELRQKRKQLAKWERKQKAKDEALASRESNLTLHEQRAQREVAVFEKDPIAWLRERKVDVRKVLLTHAQEDAEDPKEKELRSLKETTEQLKLKEEQREAEAKKEAANRQIETGIATAWGEADAGEYPLLSTLSTPERVAHVGRKLMVEHWRATGTELDPAVIFATMERELAAAQAAKRKTTTTKVESPDRVRSTQVEKPETSRETRSARDVTNRTARVRASADEAPSGKSGVDRDSLRDRLVGMVREHVRH